MKQSIWVLGFVAVLAVGILAYLFTSDFTEVLQQREKEASSTQEESPQASQTPEASKVPEAEESNDSVQDDKQLNPFGTSVKMEELNDKLYRNYIHGMSHQKVKAAEKWGFYEITDGKIQWLLKGLDDASLKNEDAYRDILERWAEGDFSRVDQDHNIIWKMQNGNVGRATGILSPEEEQAYIESQK